MKIRFALALLALSFAVAVPHSRAQGLQATPDAPPAPEPTTQRDVLFLSQPSPEDDLDEPVFFAEFEGPADLWNMDADFDLDGPETADFDADGPDGDMAPPPPPDPARRGPGGPGGFGGRRMMFNMHRRGGFGGGHMMLSRLVQNPEVREKLGITPDQAAKIRQQSADFSKAQIRNGADLKIKRLELRELTSADKPDRAAIDRKLQEVGAAQIAREKSMIDFRLTMKDALTPEQKEKLKAWHKEMMEKRMQNGPMIRRDWNGPRAPRGPRPGGPGAPAPAPVPAPQS